MKLVNVCEDTGYTYKFHIYTGKEDPGFQTEDQISPEATHLTATEKNLVFMMSSLLDQGYTGSRLYLYMMQRKTVLWDNEGESGSSGSPAASGQPARAHESSAFWPSSLCQMAKQQGGV